MRKIESFKHRQRGVGLVELMVSVTIGLLVMAGVVQLYMTSIETQRSQEGLSRIQENMRYASNRLSDEGASSGFLGCVPRLDDETRVLNLLSNDTGVDANGIPEVNNFSSSISGKEGSGLNNTDEVFFRFATAKSIPLLKTFAVGTQTRMTLDNSVNFQVAYDSINKWDIAVLTDCNYAAIFLVTNDPNTNGVVRLARNSTVPAGRPNAGQSNKDLDTTVKFTGLEDDVSDGSPRARLYLAGMGGYSYEVALSESAKQVNSKGGSAQCDTDSPQYCGLFRNGQEIMDGVLDFQVEYGWRNGNLVSFGDASAVSAVDGWNSIDRVKMDVTLSAIEVTGTNDNSASQRIKRELSQVVMLKNPVVSL